MKCDHVPALQDNTLIHWNRLNAQFVDLSGGLRGKCYMVTEFLKKTAQNGKFFIHI